MNDTLPLHLFTGVVEPHSARPLGELPPESGGEQAGPAAGENQTSHTRGRRGVARETKCLSSVEDQVSISLHSDKK